MDTLNTKQLFALAGANAIKTVVVCGTADGFTITVDGKLIELKRGNARVFKKLQAAATYLKSNGIGTFTVDLEHWHINQMPLLLF